MIASVDGRTTVEGRSVALGHPEDRALLRELRTGSDAILVGSRTVRAERYANLLDPEQRAHRTAQGLPAHPIVATVSRRLDLRASEAPIFDEPGVPICVFAQRDGDLGPCAADVQIHALGEGAVEFAAILESLAREHGVRAVLTEGGPGLLRELVAQDLVDDLLVTISPLLVAGAGPTLLAGDALAEPARLELKSVLRADSHVFLHYRAAR